MNNQEIITNDVMNDVTNDVELQQAIEDSVENYVDYYCDDSYLFWPIFEYMWSEKTRNEIMKEFYDITKDIDIDEIGDEELDGLLFGNDVYGIVNDINHGFWTCWDSNDFFNEIILGQYKDEKDVTDFWNDYGGMSQDEIIDEFIKYDGDIFYDKDSEQMIMQS